MAKSSGCGTGSPKLNAHPSRPHPKIHMQIKSLKYSEFAGEGNDWSLEETEWDSVTLLVGRNASGKSRTLRVVNGLARLVSGLGPMIFTAGTYHVRFDDDGTCIEYSLVIQDRKVVNEQFTRDGKVLLDRGVGGVGKIWAAKDEAHLDFQTPENELAVVARRDSLQHGFFEALHNWGRGVRFFQFGTEFGQKTFGYILDKKDPLLPKNTEQVIGAFREGVKLGAEKFTAAILRDMNAVGYELEEIGLQPPTGLIIEIQEIEPGQFTCLYVKERALHTKTEQTAMSQGMFRALAIVIHLNFAAVSELPSCILIDDIGEGLDFERSCSLIEVTMAKAKEFSVQLIMSTNDRFVMNKVPLEYWAVIHREGHTCKLYTYRNAKEIFDEFKFTGLNNFDFFASRFVESRVQDHNASDVKK